MTFALHHGDCLEVMATLSDASIDCVLTDPPYGTTACKWDSVIPFEPMWKELKRIAKPKAAICLFGSQPFTTDLINSNRIEFRYEFIWSKNQPTGAFNAQKIPMKAHENILVFYSGLPTYNPQKTRRTRNELKRFMHQPSTAHIRNSVYGDFVSRQRGRDATEKYPHTLLDFDVVNGRNGDKVPHPTQKPVELLRYLIRTYTNEGETVLDFTMGSGSTGVACELENRNFIGIEKDAGYFKIAEKRIAEVRTKEPLFMEAAA